MSEEIDTTKIDDIADALVMHGLGSMKNAIVEIKMEKEQALPKCGRCGGEAEYISASYIYGLGYHIQCQKCGMRTETHPTQEEALKSWFTDKPEKSDDMFGHRNSDPYSGLPEGARLTKALNDGMWAMEELGVAVTQLVQATEPICHNDGKATPSLDTLPTYGTLVSRCLGQQISYAYMLIMRLAMIARDVGRDIALPQMPDGMAQRRADKESYDVYTAGTLATALSHLRAAIESTERILAPVLSPIVSDAGVQVVNVDSEAPLVKQLQASIMATQYCTNMVRDLINRLATYPHS